MPIVAMVLTIGRFVWRGSCNMIDECPFLSVSKAILLVACARYKNPTMDALAEDNRNDVASNIVALACGLIGKLTFSHTGLLITSNFSNLFIDLKVLMHCDKRSNRKPSWLIRLEEF